MHQGRITTLIENNQLSSDLGLPNIDPAHDRIMICGSPGLLKDLKVILEHRGFQEGSTTTPGDYVVERAFVEDSDYNYLYDDGDAFVFMNPDNFEQMPVSRDVVGDMAPFLQENMKCVLSVFNGVCVAIQLPAKVILEITETEPTMKGQTASSSFKPAMLSNGVRTLVPGHITAGTKVVIMTEDSSYVERAK